MPRAKQLHKYDAALLQILEKLAVNEEVKTIENEDMKSAQRLRFLFYGAINAARKELERDILRAEDDIYKLSAGKRIQLTAIVDGAEKHEFQIKGKKLIICPIDKTEIAQLAQKAFDQLNSQFERDKQRKIETLASAANAQELSPEEQARILLEDL